MWKDWMKWAGYGTKVSFFIQCIKKQLITHQKFNIQTCFSQFLWFFFFWFWFKGPMISRIHLILPNAYKLMCFDRNINGNRDVKFLECAYLLVQQCVKLTLVNEPYKVPNFCSLVMESVSGWFVWKILSLETELFAMKYAPRLKVLVSLQNLEWPS